MKLGTRVQHLRRNGEVVTGKLVAHDPGYGRGDWVQIEWKDDAGKVRNLWTRPSQLTRA